MDADPGLETTSSVVEGQGCDAPPATDTGERPLNVFDFRHIHEVQGLLDGSIPGVEEHFESSGQSSGNLLLPEVPGLAPDKPRLVHLALNAETYQSSQKEHESSHTVHEPPGRPEQYPDQDRDRRGQKPPGRKPPGPCHETHYAHPKEMP
jgi:hypothetical protein